MTTLYKRTLPSFYSVMQMKMTSSKTKKTLFTLVQGQIIRIYTTLPLTHRKIDKF
jgi:hypothetical protein